MKISLKSSMSKCLLFQHRDKYFLVNKKCEIGRTDTKSDFSGDWILRGFAKSHWRSNPDINCEEAFENPKQIIGMMVHDIDRGTSRRWSGQYHGKPPRVKEALVVDCDEYKKHRGSARVLATHVDSKEHTPGPWRVDHPRGMYGFEIMAGNRLIAQMTPFVSREPQSESNARLIAAAPDMLAVLKRIERERAPLSQYLMVSEIDGLLRDAVKKATGTSG